MHAKSLFSHWLLKLEILGNRLPHPALLFVYLCGFILLLSALFAWLGVEARHPGTGELYQTVNLLNRDGLQRILTSTVSNFTQFAPVGTVLVAIMGIGIADESGLLKSLLMRAVSRSRGSVLTFTVVLAGVLSSLAADTGYVVLIPLAAMLFKLAGRAPLAGIAAAFAGVSGGYSANLLIGPLDVILSGLSTEAARLVDASYEVSAAGNYYFILASTLLVALIATLVTERWIEPRLRAQALDDLDNNAMEQTAAGSQSLDVSERRALQATALFTIAFIGLLLAGLVPQQGWLRDPSSGDILRSPFMKGIVVIIAFYAGICGIIFGVVSGRWKSASECIGAMEKSMVTMAGYLVLMFFAAQFVSYFSWSQLGVIAAIQGAVLLQGLDFSPLTLLLIFVFVAALINLFIGSASAKWALIAPVFVPMLLLLGIAPEATQMAFRVGDSVTNIITPLMPYFGVVVAYAQVHDPRTGVGTIMVTMIPYSLALLFGWSLLLLIWLWLRLPLGPGVDAFIRGI